jgi:hypothetical protein
MRLVARETRQNPAPFHFFFRQFPDCASNRAREAFESGMFIINTKICQWLAEAPIVFTIMTLFMAENC